MKILIAEDELVLCEILSLVVKTKFNAEVLQAHSGRQAIDIIKQNPDLDCILCDYHMPQGTGGEVYKYLQSVDSKIPYILCSSDPPDELPEFANAKLAGSVVKPFIMNQIRDLLLPIAAAAKKAQYRAGSTDPDDYIQISTSILQRIHVHDCDLYVKLSEKKFVRVKIQGDNFVEEDRKRFKAKNVEYLYIKRRDSDRLLDQFADQLLGLAMSKGSIEQGSVLRISETALELIHEVLQQLQLSEKAEKMVQASVDLTLMTIQHDLKLSRLFDRLLVDQNKYISSHSIVLGYVACGIASIMKTDDSDSSQKLVFAAFLHDITLKNESLAQYQVLDPVVMSKSYGFTQQQIAEFAEHPREAAALAKEFHSIPKEVDVIVAQHHERPDGSGFPEKLKHSGLDLLPSIFIVAHELVTFLHDSGNKSDVAEFLKKASSQFQVGHFQQIIVAMKESLK